MSLSSVDIKPVKGVYSAVPGVAFLVYRIISGLLIDIPTIVRPTARYISPWTAGP